MNRLQYSIGEHVMILRGDLRASGTIIKRKPEDRVFLVALGADGGRFWYHESQLMTIDDANRERIIRLPD